MTGNVAINTTVGSPLVSVVVPCHNLGRYLDEAVDSVLGQTLQDFEILVVDDGSMDPFTIELLADYQKPRTRVLRTENHGLSSARNFGIAHTTGPYLIMLDADDRLERTLLERSVAALESDPSLAFVSHWVRTFGDETRQWSPTQCDFPVLLDRNTVNGSALVRRRALLAVGGFDESMREGCEDWDLWISLVKHGYRGTILPEVLFQYRRRPDSMSRLMMQGDTHLHLYQYLAAKHADAFREHLQTLLVRRETDIANLRRHIHDLQLGGHQFLGPELAKWRDEVATLERKQKANTEYLNEAERTRALDRALTAARADLQEQSRVLESTVERTYALDAELNRYRSQVRELCDSASWRLTAPLRGLYAALRAITGRRP